MKRFLMFHILFYRRPLIFEKNNVKAFRNPQIPGNEHVLKDFPPPDFLKNLTSPVHILTPHHYSFDFC
jgi:hypothetical protein